MTTYAGDGSLNVTVVDGSALTGLFATDGSMNVVLSDGSLGAIYHPCGAVRVTVSDNNTGIYAPDGSMYVVESPGFTGQRVTVVSGTLNPNPGDYSPTYYFLGF